MPIGLIVRLQDEQSVGCQRPVREGEELRCQQASVAFLGIAIRLRMIKMDFCDASRSDILSEKLISANDCQSNICQAPLVGAPSGIADDDRKYFDAEVIKLR